MFDKKRRYSGFTLVEVVVALALVSLLVYVVIRALDGWKKDVLHLKTDMVSADIHKELIDSLVTNARHVQVNYADLSAEAILGQDLPMAWNQKGEKVPVDICLKKNVCPLGRYGYVVTPFVGMKGMYVLTVKITYPTWVNPKIYKILIGE